MKSLTRVLESGDRFSASTVAGRGALFGLLSAVRNLGPELSKEQPVVDIRNDFELASRLVTGSRASRLEKGGAFRVLAVSTDSAAQRVVAEAVELANRRLGSRARIDLQFVEHQRGPELRSRYRHSDLAVLAGQDGSREEESFAQLRSEMVLLGLPVLSMPRKPSGAVAFGSAFDVTALAEKLAWAVRHRPRLATLTDDEAARPGARSAGFERRSDLPALARGAVETGF